MRQFLVRREDMDQNRMGRMATMTISGRLKKLSFSVLLALLLAVNIGCSGTAVDGDSENGSKPTADTKEEIEESSAHTASGLPKKAKGISLTEIPPYSGNAYVVVNGNMPYFTEEDCSEEPFEKYSDLDSLGRCGVAFANVCQEIMPTEERGPIGHVRPSGWHTVKYDNVDGNYLYNRCHLIGYQLAGENANEQNLITGTRYLNTEGMLPFENEVADYVKETDHHVLYRVTPMFEGDNLVADGVLMEAWSVEDDGAGVCFHVFVYNVQPGIGIDFATGESWKENQDISAADREAGYILNTNTKKFHYPTCSSVQEMSDANKQEYVGTREELVAQGYDPCGRCHP